MRPALPKIGAALLVAAVLNGCATAPATGPVAPPAPTEIVAPPVVAEPATPTAGESSIELPAVPAADDDTSTGLGIYRSFRAGLASPQCDDTRGSKWRKHYSHAPEKLAGDRDVLPLFGHVVSTLRQAQLPTEFALIPFIESDYEPRAHSRNGPAGMWQFIALTARNQGVRINKGYDGRYSPVDSTRAATRYLKQMYDEFGGDWRLAMMAYNAGEFRMKGAMRRAGMSLADAQEKPWAIPGLSPITYAYVQKLHALACLFEDAGGNEAWLARLDHPVPPLRGSDAAAVVVASADAPPAPAAAMPKPAKARPVAHSHKVKRGDSVWSIAQRYGMSVAKLLSLNRLDGSSVLKPGMVLQLD